MSETARHQTEDQDSSLQAISALSMLDLTELSFVQLCRLHKVLQQLCEDVARESDRRSGADNSGDTVRVPSPDL